MKRVITEQAYNNMKNRKKTFTEKYREGYAKWLSNEAFNWSYVGTYRPLKTKVNSVNALKLFKQTVANYCISKGSNEAIKYIYYTIEQDRSLKCNHVHFVVDSGSNKVGRVELASAMKRHATKEVKYFEPIATVEGAISYITKKIGAKNLVTGHALVDSITLETEHLKKHYPFVFDQDNKEYYEKAQLISRLAYGWLPNTRYQ